MKALLDELRSHQEKNHPLVLCTVVETRGSTPQKPGASMLVFPDGSQSGTLGGGCIEAEVKKQSLGILHREDEGGSPPTLFSFQLDDNYGWDDGLICGGRMTILADPIRDEVGRAYYQRLQKLLEQGMGGTEVIPVQSSLQALCGGRVLFDQQGKWLANRNGSDHLPANLKPDIPPLADRPRPFSKNGLSYLPILPRVTLFIVGGGHVGQAVAQLASQADFDIEVLDDRESYVSQVRFPFARKRIAGDIGNTLHQLSPSFGPNHFLLIVTRGHHHDEEALFHLAPTGAGYLGMIGSKRKIRLIFDDLMGRGISPECLDRVHAPLGFDIGSQTVPEIAISIVAELIAARNLGTTVPRPRSRLRPTAPVHRESQCSRD